MHTQTSYRIISLLIFLGGFSNNISPIIVHWLQEKYYLSIPEATLLQFSYFIGYFFMGLPSAYFVSALGHRNTIIGACILAGSSALLGLLLPDNIEYYCYFPIFFLLSCAIITIRVAALPYLATLKDDIDYPAKMSFFLAFDTIGATIAPAVTSFIVFGSNSFFHTHLFSSSSMGLHSFFLFLFFVYFIALSLVVCFIKNDAYTSKGDFSFKDAISVASRNDVWKGFLSIFCFVGIEFSVVHYLIQYLHDVLHYSDKFTGICVSLYWLQMLIGRIVVSYFRIYISTKVQLLAPIYAALSLCLLVVILPQSLVYYPLLLLGLCNASLYPSLYGIYTRSVALTQQHYVSCLCLMATCGGAILPYVQSYLFTEATALPAFLLIVLSYTYLLVASHLHFMSLPVQPVRSTIE